MSAVARHTTSCKPFDPIGNEQNDLWLDLTHALLNISSRALLLLLPTGHRESHLTLRGPLHGALFLYQNDRETSLVIQDPTNPSRAEYRA